jgi:hypothetical protein
VGAGGEGLGLCDRDRGDLRAVHAANGRARSTARGPARGSASLLAIAPDVLRCWQMLWCSWAGITR